jgi:hypothetical protein
MREPCYGLTRFCAGAVLPIAVVEEVRLVILILGGEPEGIDLGHGAGGAEEFPEGAFEASPWISGKALNLREMRIQPRTASFSEARASTWT